MQRTAKITSKGQITVPSDIRLRLGVRPGDRLVFEENESGIQIRALRVRSPFEKYQGIGNPGIPSGRNAIVKYFRGLRGK